MWFSGVTFSDAWQILILANPMVLQLSVMDKIALGISSKFLEESQS